MLGVNFTFTSTLIPIISLNRNLTIYLLPKLIMTSFNCIALSFFYLLPFDLLTRLCLYHFFSILFTSLSSILLLSSSIFASKLFTLFSKFLTLLTNILSFGSNSTSRLHVWLLVLKHEEHACFKHMLHVNLFF
jgi:hypothetical protein